MNSLRSRLFVVASIHVISCLHVWAANLTFGDQPQTGMINSVAQNNSYTFSANAKDVISVTLVTTSGKLSPRIRVYDPAGTLIADGYSGGYTTWGAPPCGGGPIVEMNNVNLPTTNTYTALVSDCGNVNTGDYLIYVQRTNNPAGAANLPFGGQLQTGTINSPAQDNSYMFGARANDVLNFTMVTTSGKLSPRIRLYDPTGTLIGTGYSGGYTTWGAPPCGGGSVVEWTNVKLPTTGTYTALIGDCGHTNTGAYTLSSRCFGVCTSPPGPAPLPRSGVLSHIAAGGSWSTVITLTNMSSRAVPVAVAFRNDDGTDLSLPVTTTNQGVTRTTTTAILSDTINANATLLISTGPSASTVVGWAEVSSSMPVSGFAIFRTDSSKNPVSEGTVPLQTQFPSIVTLPYDNTDGFVMGAAVANLSTTSANITATIWDDRGNQLGTQSLWIAANGHTSFVLTNQVPFTAGKRGFVQLQSGASGGLAGLGLRFSPFATFTSLPAM